MHWNLERSTVLTSIWRIEDMKHTLWSHANISRSVHCDNVVISTILGIILSVLSWTLGRRMMISHSLPILHWTMFAKAQCLMKEHMVRDPLRFAPPCPPVLLYTGSVVRQTKLFFLTVNEVKDDMKWINENMKWHEEEGIESWRMLMGWNWGKGTIPWKTPTLPTAIDPLTTPSLKLGTPDGIEKWSNHSYADSGRKNVGLYHKLTVCSLNQEFFFNFSMLSCWEWIKTHVVFSKCLILKNLLFKGGTR